MPLNPHPKLERAVAMIELIISLVLAIIVGGACKDLFFTPPRQHPIEGEWTPLVIFVCTPLLLTFTVASLTMWCQVRYRWRIQILPIIVLLGMLWFLIT